MGASRSGGGMSSGQKGSIHQQAVNLKGRGILTRSIRYAVILKILLVKLVLISGVLFRSLQRS